MEHFTLGSRYYYSRLPQFEKEKYRKTYDQWVNGGTCAEFDLPGTELVFPSGLRIDDFVKFILADNPQLFHLDLSCIHCSRNGKKVRLWTDAIYSNEEFLTLYRALRTSVNCLLHEAEKLDSDYRKVRFFHDYLAKTNEYSMQGPDERSKLEAHTIVGGLLRHQCVCDGYARAFRLLCDLSHISCIVALGKGKSIEQSEESEQDEDHAWNFIKLDRRVYHCDVTWDSGLYHKDSPFWDYYFLRSDQAFVSDHQWDQELYPPILQDHPMRQKPISDKWELEKDILMKMQAGEDVFVVPLSRSFPGAEAVIRLLNEIIGRNPGVFRRRAIDHTEYYDQKKILVVYKNEENTQDKL